MKHLEIPKRAIEFIVGKLHISESDEQVRAEVVRRIDAITDAAAKHCWTEAKIKAACDYAVKVHHNNRGLYDYVMSGEVSRGSRRRNK
jgi:hypothetical protein